MTRYHVISKDWRTLHVARSRLYRSRFCIQIHVGKLSPRFTQCTPLCCSRGIRLGEKIALFSKLKILFKEAAKFSAIFNENFEIGERCKGVHFVNLGESFPTSIYLQNLASIQPRTSSPKFAEASKRYPTPVINLALYNVECGLIGSSCPLKRLIRTPYSETLEGNWQSGAWETMTTFRIF